MFKQNISPEGVPQDEVRDMHRAGVQNIGTQSKPKWWEAVKCPKGQVKLPNWRWETGAIIHEVFDIFVVQK